ncbi:MAG: tetratricopeptide repeat protein [Anaerolineae bacterium]|nr:tetratricopeptide repeat protein [Anaerolineae bacterium]
MQHRQRGRTGRRLLLAVFLLFVLVSIVAATSVGIVYVFRTVLLPGQQQRIIDQLPFMRALMVPTPPGGTLPTAVPVDGAPSAFDLLAELALPEATVTKEPEFRTPETTATSTVVVVATASPAPTSTPTPSPSPTAAPPLLVTQVTESSVPATVRLTGFSHITQTWNNCGPANLAMALSYFGWNRGQIVIADRLKPHREDKNVSPQEMVAFVNEATEVKAVTRMGGNINVLKQLLAADMPVVVETGFTPEGYDWLGHYQTLVAYDDASGTFWLYDSFLGDGQNSAGMTESYKELDDNWRPFNRSFIVLYLPEQEGTLRRILGDLVTPAGAAEVALETARFEAQADRRNAFAWFNMGTSLAVLGRPTEAATAFDQARRIGTLPWRMTWYQFGPFEAYFRAGRLDDVQALVSVNMGNGARFVEETWFWQGRVMQQRGDLQGARNAYTQALQLNRFYEEARAALAAL